MSNPLISVSQLQAAPGCPPDMDPSWGAFVVSAATDLIEGHCDRSFEYSESALTADELYEGDRSEKLYLRRYPVLGPVQRVQALGNTISDWTLVNDPDDFEPCRFLYRGRGWDSFCSPPAEGWCLWGYPIAVQYRGGYLLPATSYTAPGSPPSGYVAPQTLPVAVQMAAVIVSLAVLLRCPEPGLMEERTTAGWTKRWEPDKFVTGEGGYGLPGAAVDYLKKYKRRTR